MKRHSLFTEIIIFSAIFLSAIVPSITSQIFFSNENAFSQWIFNPYVLVTLIIGIIIIFFFYEKQKYQNILVNLILPSTFIFCVLFFFSLIFKFISVFTANTGAELTVELPKNFFQWLICILQFGVAAFYEEVIYRFYLPETLNTWISSKSSKKIFLITSEIFIMICFASAHFYLGILAVLNACIAHFVLRFSFKKSKSLIPNVIAHFLYNIISLILL